jgi:hypothetical protein
LTRLYAFVLLGMILVVTIAMASCAQVNSARDWLASPATQAAAATLRSGAVAFVCAVSNAAAVAAQIENAVNAKAAVIGTTGKVLTVSSIVCTDMIGGRVTGTAIAP